MAVNDPTPDIQDQAAELNKVGLKHFSDWEIDEAIAAFSQAASTDPENPEYHLNLARAYARGGNYAEAMRALGDYLHNETDDEVAGQFEWLFSSTFDKVESGLIEGMQALELPVEMIGRAIRMWLEYRLAVGRRPLQLRNPNLWSAALTYLICKVNLLDVDRVEVAAVYDVELNEFKETCTIVVEGLDLIPGDYRYFIGDENPLDKVFEAAQVLDKIYRDFEEEW